MEFFLIIGAIIGIYWLVGFFFDNSSTSSKKHTDSNHRGYNAGFYSNNHTTSSSGNSFTNNHVTSNKTTYINTDKLRAEFEEFKTTETYKKWRKAQYDCQNGQCAWCKCHLDLHSPYTQTDHIKPLCQGGSPTDLDNLVLACKSCNYWYKKGNYTWRDRNGTVHNGWSKPSWIRNNPVTTEQTEDYSKSNSYDLSEIPF